MLATETTQHFHSYKKRKENEGGEKVSNLRSDIGNLQPMKSPDESRSPEVGIRKLQFLSAKSLTIRERTGQEDMESTIRKRRLRWL